MKTDRLDALRLKVLADNTAATKQTGRRWQSSSGPSLRRSSYASSSTTAERVAPVRRCSKQRGFDTIPILTWGSTEVGQWLESIGLSQKYRSAFTEIDGRSLLGLGLDDLDFLDVRAPADRKSILQAIANLNAAHTRGWTLRKFHANPPVANRRRQTVKPPTPPNLRHWSTIKPLVDENIVSPPEEFINSADRMTKRFLLDDETSGKMWTNGGGTLLEGSFDEVGQQKSFREAVAAWRGESQEATTKTCSCGDGAEDVATRKSAQQVADELAKRLDEAYAVETANLSRRKIEARDKLSERQRRRRQDSFSERRVDEEEDLQDEARSPRITLVESRLGCSEKAEDAGLSLGYTVTEA